MLRIDNLNFLLTFLAAIACGLEGGLFFAFSAFVMRALGRVAPETGIAAMQSIDASVYNPVFLAAFFWCTVVMRGRRCLFSIQLAKSENNLRFGGMPALPYRHDPCDGAFQHSAQ